ncbi:MAG: aryl-sulfate sulfotransferase [Dehalococcoidia bacterium]
MGWSINQRRGLTHSRPDRSIKGYTLIAPLFGNAAYLIDMAGRVVHTWDLGDLGGNLARLLPNGHLLTLGPDRAKGPATPADEADFLPLEERARSIGGNGALLRELDWDGSVLWEYRNPAMHHDFVRLPNGHTLIPEWIELSDDLAKRVRGGWNHRGKQGPLIGDDIVEIDGDGGEVRRLRTWEMLDPRRDPICPLERRTEWTHVNSLDVNDAGDIAFSCRQNSRVGIIDGASGTLRWKYGAPDTYHQHHATFQAEGRIQIFDNGMHSRGQPASKVIEVDPNNNEVTWTYQGAPTLQFFSPHISNAQRLPGGNNLVCEGATGRIFEITKQGEVVWEWLSPFFNEIRGQLLPWTYRAYRYPANDPAVAGRDLDPARWASLNRLHGLE